MPKPDVYVDLEGREICLGHLDAEERKLLGRIRRRAASKRDWNEFDNYWTVAVPAFYQARGLTPRQAVLQTIPWRIAQDLSGRIAIASGWARLADYRDDLQDLIRDQFPSQRAFCKATGLGEDMLSHFLAGRKDLSLASLEQALDRIGYRLRVVPSPVAEPARRASAKEPKRPARSA